MSSSAFNQSVLDFDLDVSVTLSALYFLLYSAATFAVFLSGLPLYAKIIAGILIAVSLAFRLYLYVLLRHPRSVVAIHYREPSWFLRLRSGEDVHTKVRGQLLLTSLLLVIYVVDEQGRRFAVLMFKYSVSEEQHLLGRVFFSM